MVKLYRYDEEQMAWVFFGWGLKTKVKEYTMLGFIVFFM
jgi:hypothetical protein